MQGTRRFMNIDDGDDLERCEVDHDEKMIINVAVKE